MTTSLNCCYFRLMFNHCLAFIILLFALSGCKKSKFDSEYHTLQHDGEKRSYLLHVPNSYDGAETSLIIALHGGTGSAKNIEEQSGLPTLSDTEGFILCSPNGLKKSWNAGGCCGWAERKNADDVGFISKLIDHLLAEYSIDPNRVYITGMSNGGMMSYRLACELSDKVAAIAPVAGTMVFDCNPSSAVSVIHFHSYEDGNVPFEGGVGDGISDHYNAPVDSVIHFWAEELSCQSDSMLNNTDFDFWAFSSCNDSSEVQLYVTNDGGHSWPGGVAPREKADDPSAVIDANALMWEFFKQHPKQ